MVATVGFVVAIVCFAAAGLLGGVPWDATGPSWLSWLDGWRQAAWADGPTIVRDYPWAGGDSLRIDAPASLDYIQGPTSKLTISGPEGLLDRLIVQNGRIGFNGWMGNAGPLKIVMTAPNVTDFEASGAQTLSIANYKQDELTVEISGAGVVVARGEAKRSAVHISGSGDADLGGLAGDDATVQISGAGRATIAPKSSADVDISGLGQVTLLTHPATLNQHISGLGSITQLDAK
jgi:hypothetical protein